jgi:hypothetical protein
MLNLDHCGPHPCYEFSFKGCAVIVVPFIYFLSDEVSTTQFHAKSSFKCQLISIQQLTNINPTAIFDYENPTRTFKIYIFRKDKFIIRRGPYVHLRVNRAMES